MNLTPDHLACLADAARCPLQFAVTPRYTGWLSTDKPATLLHDARTVRQLGAAQLLASQGKDRAVITDAGRRALRRHERERQRTLAIGPTTAPAPAAQRSKDTVVRGRGARGVLAVLYARLAGRRA
jgi:hypothetical protein